MDRLLCGVASEFDLMLDNGFGSVDTSSNPKPFRLTAKYRAEM